MALLERLGFVEVLGRWVARSYGGGLANDGDEDALAAQRIRAHAEFYRPALTFAVLG